MVIYYTIKIIMSIPFLIIFKIFLLTLVIANGILMTKGRECMAVSDKVRALLNLKGRKIMELADYFEMSPQAMRNKLNRGSFSAEDLIRVSMFLDAELSFRVSDNQSIVLDENDLRLRDTEKSS